MMRQELKEHASRTTFKLDFFDWGSHHYAQWSWCPVSLQIIDELEITLWIGADEGFDHYSEWSDLLGITPRALFYVINRVLTLGLHSIGGPEPKVPKPISVKHLKIKPKLLSEYMGDSTERDQQRIESLLAFDEAPLRTLLTLAKHFCEAEGSLGQVSLVWPDNTVETLSARAFSREEIQYREGLGFYWRHRDAEERDAGKITESKNEKVQKQSKSLGRRVLGKSRRDMSNPLLRFRKKDSG